MVQAIAVSQPPPRAKPLICGDHWFPEVFYKVQNRLPKAARPFCLDRSDVSELADVCACDEGLIARSRNDHAAHIRVIPRLFKSVRKSSQVR